MKPRRWLRWTFLGVAVLAVAGVIGVLADGWRAFGHRATGTRRARIERSPQWKKSRFENPQPLSNDWWGALTGAFHASDHTSPTQNLPTVAIDPKKMAAPPTSGLRVTWLGHAASLIEVDGHRILTDPVWSERASPFGWIGPRRWYKPAIALDDLPTLDAVVVSHDHYDHLDHRTIAALAKVVADKGWDTVFVVPLGIGAHLAYWGVPETRIVELDWWERTRTRKLEIVCTPARHASGRTMLFDDGATLWAGYAFIGEQHRVYFSGDTGLFPAMEEIGSRLGPFDLTMIEVGQYHRAWPDWHIGPEQAVAAHRMLRGRVMLPMHWGLFTLAYHGWTEPVERVLAAAGSAAVAIVAPRPGQSIEPDAPPGAPTPPERWWPSLPWQTAAEHPIVSTKVQATTSR